MFPIFLLLFGLLSGCATGGQADTSRRPWLAMGNTPPESKSEPEAESITPYQGLNRPIRVRIVQTSKGVKVGGTGPYEFGSTRSSMRFESSINQTARVAGSAITVGSRSFQGDVILKPKLEGAFLTVNGKRFRGTLLLHRAPKKVLEIIEEVDLEEYLYGVLPREVGGSWPEEALKAQAVISRSYALASFGEGGSLYDVSNDVMSQVYGGFDVELPVSNKAVDDTRGQVLLNKEGRPLLAFFHASCGGETDLPEAVWPSRVSNESFGQIHDSYCKEYPRQNWSVEMTWTSLHKSLKRAGINVRDVKGLSIAKKTDGGRAEFFNVKTSKGTVEVQGNRFRLAVGPEKMRSTRITDIDNGRKMVRIEGQGWGHGVGLCQWGARGRSLAGQDYRKILAAYYPGATFTKQK